MKKLSYLIAIVLGLCFWSRPAHDPDLGWHLAGGAWIYAHQSLPTFDFINSFSDQWHDYHWLAQLIFFQLYDWGGYDLLHLFLGLLSAGTLVVVLDTIYFCLGTKDKAACSDFLPALFYFIPCALLLYEVTSVRPQVLSLSLLALCQHRLVQKQKTGGGFYLFALAILAVNIHVYWVFIPFLWFCYRCLPRFYRTRSVGPLQAWAGLLIISASGLISPYGILGDSWRMPDLLMNYALIWDYLNFPPYLKNTISEFKSPLSGSGLITFLLLAYLGFLFRTFYWQKFLAKGSSALAACSGFFLACRAAKFMGVFAILGLPYFISFSKKHLRSFCKKHLRDCSRLFGIMLLGAGLIYAMLTLPYYDSRSRFLRQNMPFAACEAIASINLPVNRARGHLRLATHFDYGGWCRWIIYQKNPQKDVRVTTDGRTQGIPFEHFKAGFDLFRLNEGWSRTLAQWSPDIILAAREHPLSHLMFMLQQDWGTVYQDSNFAVFVRKPIAK